jgi:hypothetical protein
MLPAHGVESYRMHPAQPLGLIPATMRKEEGRGMSPLEGSCVGSVGGGGGGGANTGSGCICR